MTGVQTCALPILIFSKADKNKSGTLNLKDFQEVVDDHVTLKNEQRFSVMHKGFHQHDYSVVDMVSINQNRRDEYDSQESR